MTKKQAIYLAFLFLWLHRFSNHFSNHSLTALLVQSYITEHLVFCEMQLRH